MLKYHVKDNESHKTIIFITGAGVGKWMWQHQMNLPFNLVTFDLPGHGDNADKDFESIAKTCNEIIKIINDLKLDKVILIGHSIGAQIILYMMENHSEYIDKALVVSGLNQPSKLMASMMKPTIAMTMPLIKNRSFSKLQAGTLSLPDYMLDVYYEDSLKMSKRTLTNLLTQNQLFEFKGSTLNGDQVLFMYGSKEVKMIKKSAQKNQKLVPGSKLRVLGAGHGIPYEVMDEFNQSIIEFIRA